MCAITPRCLLSFSSTTSQNQTHLPLRIFQLLLWEKIHHAAAAKSLQSCPTLCDPIDGSPPGSLVPGILQAKTLEWVAISFSNAWKWKVKVKSLSRVRLLATPWTAAYQAPPSMGFSRQEYWSGVPLWTNLNLPIPVFHSPFVRQSDNFQFYIDKFSLLFLMGTPNEVDW